MSYKNINNESYKNNPHICQSKQYCQNLKIYDTVPRILHNNFERLKYQRRKNHNKTVVHWGQRKLLMSEIEFLTTYAEKGDIVVYAGAAPGNHTYLLSLMFPFVKFYLIDPNPFYCIETDRITIINELFTDKMAEEFSNLGNVLFISDIRSASWQTMTSSDVENSILNDMLLQQNWHLIMKPKMSMLKFRLPWKDGFTEYLDGAVHLPVWGPITTTETRLVTNSTIVVKWDNRKYEDQMFYFNTITRTQLYNYNKSITSNGLDNCFDCASEVYIWYLYFKKYMNVWSSIKTKIERVLTTRKETETETKTGTETETKTETETDIEKVISNAIIIASKMCSNGRQLDSVLKPVEKRNWFT